MQKMQKKGQALIALLVIGLLVIGGIAVYGVMQSQTGPQSEIIEKQLTDCDTQPYLEDYFVDKLNAGTTTTSGGAKALINGKLKTITFGSSGTTFAIGDKIDVIANGSGYLDTVIKGIEIDKCGLNEAETELYKLDGTPTIRIFNDAGNLLGDGLTGDANQTSSANPITVDMHITIPTDEGAEAVYIVIEAENSTEVDKIGFSCNSGSVSEYKSNQPDFHVAEGSGSNKLFNTYKLEGMAVNGGKTICSLTLEPETGKTMGAGDCDVYVTAYFPQWAIDIDGKLIYDIQNSDGTAIHEDSADVDFDFSIGNE